MDKDKINRFTPEELGLKRIVVDGKKYIDVTPFWIDSDESRRIRNLIENRQARGYYEGG